MTESKDVRGELERIWEEHTGFIDDSDVQNFHKQEALTAIEKLIDERYVAVNGTDYVFDKEKHDKTYITRQEAFDKAVEVVDFEFYHGSRWVSLEARENIKDKLNSAFLGETSGGEKQ